MAKAKHKKHGKSAHAHADDGHGHDDHAADGHDAHGHDEPAPPPEPETPLWFSLLGGALFIVFGLLFLVLNGDDTAKTDGAETGKADTAEAAKRPSAAAAQADDAAKRPVAPPIRRLQAGDLEKKRLTSRVRFPSQALVMCRIVPLEPIPDRRVSQGASRLVAFRN